MYSRRHYSACVLEQSRAPEYVQERRRPKQTPTRALLLFNPGTAAQKSNPAENSHGCRIGTSGHVGTASRHRRPFLAFFSLFSLSSVFACLRELSLPAGCLFHGFYLFFTASPSFSIQHAIVRQLAPRPFSTSAIYDFILGQVDRRRYNTTTTTALLSLDCYTTAIISMSTSTLEPLRGSCSCGRNRYLIRILGDNVTDHAQIHFDSSSDNRASDYTLPLYQG